MGLLKNKWLLVAMVGTMAATLPIIYIPALQEYFHTYSLSWKDWGIAILASLRYSWPRMSTRFCGPGRW